MTKKKQATQDPTPIERIKSYLRDKGSNRHRALMAFDLSAGLIKGYSLQSQKGKTLFETLITPFDSEFQEFGIAMDKAGIAYDEKAFALYARGMPKAAKKAPWGHNFSWKGSLKSDGTDTRDERHIDFFAMTLADTNKALREYTKA